MTFLIIHIRSSHTTIIWAIFNGFIIYFIFFFSCIPISVYSCVKTTMTLNSNPITFFEMSANEKKNNNNKSLSIIDNLANVLNKSIEISKCECIVHRKKKSNRKTIKIFSHSHSSTVQYILHIAYLRVYLLLCTPNLFIFDSTMFIYFKYTPNRTIKIKL